MFHVYEHRGMNFINVGVDLDIASSGSLAFALDLAANMPYRRTVVSLIDCRFCDSTGLSVLVRAKRRLGERLVIVGPSRKAGRRAFDITEMTEALALCATMDEALSIPPRAPAKAGEPNGRTARPGFG